MVRMFLHTLLLSSTGSLSFDEILSIIALVVNGLQAVVLPITIYLCPGFLDKKLSRPGKRVLL